MIILSVSDSDVFVWIFSVTNPLNEKVWCTTNTRNMSRYHVSVCNLHNVVLWIFFLFILFYLFFFIYRHQDSHKIFGDRLLSYSYIQHLLYVTEKTILHEMEGFFKQDKGVKIVLQTILDLILYVTCSCEGFMQNYLYLFVLLPATGWTYLQDFYYFGEILLIS